MDNASQLKFITDPQYLDTFKLGAFSDLHWYATFILDNGDHFSLLRKNDESTVNQDVEIASIKLRLSKIDIPAISAGSSTLKFLSENVDRFDGQGIEQKGSFSFLDNSSMEYTQSFREKLGLPQMSIFDFSKVMPGFRKEKIHLKITYNDNNTLYSTSPIKVIQKDYIFEDIVIIGSDEFEYKWDSTDYRETKFEFVYKRQYGGTDI